jgi:predicted nucleotidyltransferase
VPPSALPAPHAAFLRHALARLGEDERIVGVAAGGSYVSGTLDEWSDLDLVLAVEPSAYAGVSRERAKIAASLGHLLAFFTGEHVGEPRVLICLYGPPLLHVDLKFVSLDDVARRVEDPSILWERDRRLSGALALAEAEFPAPDLQWIEDRFWVWVHYGVTKIGRGELFEAQDMLALLRGQVLGPLALQEAGARPTGVRKLEQLAPERARAMEATVAGYDRAACARALQAAAQVYRDLRGARRDIVLRREAETAAMAYLEEVLDRAQP